MIKKRLSKLEKQYNFQYNGYLIRPAASTSELIEEGKVLDHCVATHYTIPYAKGHTVILFVRKVSDVQTPFCTVEVKNNIVVQAYIKHDRRPNKETLAFLEIFKKERLQQSKRKKKIA